MNNTTNKKVPLQLSVNEAIRHWAQYSPENVAIASELGKTTYRELQQKVLIFQAALRSKISTRQTPVGILVADKSNFIAALSAVLAEEHSLVILNQKVSDKHVSLMLKDSNCKTVIVDNGLEPKLSDSKDHIQVINVEQTLANRWSTYSPTNSFNQHNQRFVDDTWATIYSSGTTGNPKGVVRTDLAMLSELIGWCFELPIRKTTSMYLSRPVYYTGGLVLATATLLVGGTILAASEHTIDNYAKLVKQYPTTIAFMLPIEAKHLVEAKRLDPNLPAPVKILTMGAPSTPELKLSVINNLHCDYIESWGNSEGLGTITDPVDALIRPTSIGRPFLTDKMFVISDEHSEVPTTQVGQLCGIADSGFEGYHNRDDLNEKVRMGNLIISEDLGYKDSDGYFYIKGRTVERFLRNGIPVYTTDIEKIILKNPLVEEVKVISLEDSLEGEVPVAVVVLHDAKSITETKLLKVLNSELIESQKLTALKVIHELPVNAAGKIHLVNIKENFTTQVNA